MSTTIDNLKNSKTQNTSERDLDISLLNQIELGELICDLSIDVEKRIVFVDEYFIKYGNEFMEILNKLIGMYTFSGTRLLEQYLCEMSTSSNIDIVLKLESAQRLCFYNKMKNEKRKKIGYNTLNAVCSNDKYNSLPTPVKIKGILMLMVYDPLKVTSLQYFSRVISDGSLECDYRYKTLLSVETKIEDSDLSKWYIEQLQNIFVTNENNETFYRILAGQYLIQKCKIENPSFVEDVLLSFAMDENIEYNLRADSADVLLKSKNDNTVEVAGAIIASLGCDGGDGKTVYCNAQNVHTREVDDSVAEIIESLSKLDMCKKPGTTTEIDFDYVSLQIRDMCNDGDRENVTVSLNRIFMDRAMYSKYSYTLRNILLKIWSMIVVSNHIEEMKIRLVQELVEMAHTCSSGFSSRLCNVVSGFGNLNIRISWGDQISANLNGRLNAKIRDINTVLSDQDRRDITIDFLTTNATPDDLNFGSKCKIRNKPESKEQFDLIDKYMDEAIDNFRDDVVMEMSYSTFKWDKRMNFHKFFRRVLSGIIEEMRSEFVEEYMSNIDFDLYMRRAISTYEGCNEL